MVTVAVTRDDLRSRFSVQGLGPSSFSLWDTKGCCDSPAPILGKVVKVWGLFVEDA